MPHQPNSCPPNPPNPAATEALYPAESAPELRLPTLSALCSYGPTPLVLQGALRQVVPAAGLVHTSARLLAGLELVARHEGEPLALMPYDLDVR